MKAVVYLRLHLTLGIMAADMTVRAQQKGQIIIKPAVKYVSCIEIRNL